METETYKNAKLILERFDPESKSKAVRVGLRFPALAKPYVLKLHFFFLKRVSCFSFSQEAEATPVPPLMTPRPGQGTSLFFSVRLGVSESHFLNI